MGNAPHVLSTQMRKQVQGGPDTALSDLSPHQGLRPASSAQEARSRNWYVNLFYLIKETQKLSINMSLLGDKYQPRLACFAVIYDGPQISVSAIL